MRTARWGYLRDDLLRTDRADVAARGRVHGRRLTRVEYEHTLHDLLGIDLALRLHLPEDPAVQGFETVADAQQLSHHLIARYLDTADQALREAFQRALSGDQTYRVHYAPEKLTTSRGPQYRDGRSIAWTIPVNFYGRTPTAVPQAGWYRVTIRSVQALNPGAEGAVWGTLRSGEGAATAPILHLVGLIEATNTPRDLTFEAWIEEGHRLELRPNDNTLKKTPSGGKGGQVNYGARDLAAEGYPPKLQKDSARSAFPRPAGQGQRSGRTISQSAQRRRSPQRLRPEADGGNSEGGRISWAAGKDRLVEQSTREVRIMPTRTDSLSCCSWNSRSPALPAGSGLARQRNRAQIRFGSRKVRQIGRGGSATLQVIAGPELMTAPGATPTARLRR